MNRSLPLSLTVLLSLGSGLAMAQGPLTPPNTAGPIVGPTAPLDGSGIPQAGMKTLHQVEPRIALAGGTIAHVISQPGSYYLTGNLNQSGTTSGITISADNVVLDLNGFSLIGSGAGTGACGVEVQSFNVSVFNGTARGWSGSGFDGGTGTRFEKLLARNNSSYGITGGDRALILGCVVTNSLANFSYGIHGGASSLVKDCLVSGSPVYGITINSNSFVDSCKVEGGERGIVLFSTGKVRGCSVSGASLYGIFASENCSITDCKVTGEPLSSTTGIYASHGADIQRCSVTSFYGSSGIEAGTGSLVKDSLVRGCTVTYGIRAGGRSSIVSCVSSENTSAQSESAGIYLVERGGVLDCTTSGNISTASSVNDRTGAGIITGSQSKVERCSSEANVGAGIVVNSLCEVTGNLCVDNGASNGNGSGIFSSGFNNRIDGNTLQFNDFGVRLTSTPNVVIRNVSRFNGWSIVAGNHVAPMVTMTTTGAAITGTTGGTALGTTDPYANLMY